MVLETYPLDNVDYSAEDAELFHCTRSSGIYANDDFDCSVTGADNTITIGVGLGWIRNSKFSGKVVALKAAMTLDMGLPDAVYPRIDAVVIQFDANKNGTEIVVKRGVAASVPAAPAISKTESLYELHLYHVRREPGAAAISVSSITDLRLDPNYCGLMADSVTHVDTAAISAQVNALIESLRQEIQSVKDGSAYLMRSGGTMSGPINMNGQAIKGLNAPTTDDEAVNWGSVKDLGKVSSVTVTLAASGWVNNSQTVNVSGVTKDAAVIVSSAPENLDDYADSGVYCSASDDGTLVFRCKDVPAISLSVNVVLLGVSGGSVAYPAAEGGSF